MSEIKRLLNKKVIIILILIMLGNILTFLLFQIGNVDFHEFLQNNIQYNNIVDQLDGLSNEDVTNQITNMLEEDKNTVNLALEEKTTYLFCYHESIQKVFENAENAQEFSIFRDTDSFSYSNIIKTTDDFSRVKNLILTLDKDRATEHVIQYNYVAIFVFIFMIYVIYEIIKERENGMSLLTHSMKNGRGKLALERGVSLIVITFISVILLNIINIMISCILYGIDDFSGPIQTISAYSYYTRVISKGGYLLLFMLKQAFAVSVVVIITYMLFVIMDNRNFTVFLLFIIFSIEWKLSVAIAVNSNFKLLRYINLIQFFDYTDYDRNYKNINLLGNAVSITDIFIIAGILLMIGSLMITCICYKHKYPMKQFSKFDRCITMLQERVQRVLSKFPLTLLELYKLLIAKKSLFMIVIALIISIYTLHKTQITFPELQMDMDTDYAKYGGSDWSAFETYVEELTNWIADNKAAANDLMDQISNGQLGSDRYEEAIQLMAECATKEKWLEEYNAKIELRNTVNSTFGIDIYVVSDRGYNEIIGSNSTLREIIIETVLIILAVLISSGMLGIEKESHTKQILRLSGKGLSWIWKTKMVSGMLTLGIVFILIYGYNLLYLFERYNIMYLNAPIQSLTFMSEHATKISILQYLILCIIFRLFIFIASAMVTILISSFHRFYNYIYIPVIIILFSAAYIVVMASSIGTILIGVIISFILIIFCGLNSYRIWCK